jgi:hypothetical protein
MPLVSRVQARLLALMLASLAEACAPPADAPSPARALQHHCSMVGSR